MTKVLIGILAVMLASSAARATSEYLLGNGVNSGNIEWNDDENFASLQVFPTNSNSVIQQLKVAWGNQTGDAEVVLYSLDNGYQLPHGGTLVDTSKVHVLQVVNTTVTSPQTNAFTGTQTNPTWTAYSITPTTITTNYFAVGTIQHVADPNNYSSNTMDLTTNLAADGSNGYSWFGSTQYPNVLSTNLAESGTGPNGPRQAWVSDYGWAGYGNNPYLIGATAAAPVPEPMTMATMFMALGGLGAWVRRRMAKPQA